MIRSLLDMVHISNTTSDSNGKFMLNEIIQLSLSSGSM
jgi:hypothetical protein